MLEPSHLSQRDRDRLGELAKSLVRAWEEARQIGSTVVLTEFFPAPGDALRGPGLPALVAVDLRYRWKRGESIYIEDYIKQVPELGGINDIPPRLIADEYEVRQQYGDRPPLGQYAKRFPQQYAEVQRLLPDAAAKTPNYGTLVARMPKDEPEEASISRAGISGAPSHPKPDLRPPTSDLSGALPGPTRLPPSQASPPSKGEGKNPPAKQPPPIATAITMVAPLESIQTPLQTPTPTSRPESPPPSLVTSPQTVLPYGGGYKLIEKIGEGQFGEVWKAEAPGGIEAAIKIIRFPIGHQMSQIELHALELMKGIRHPFLVQVQAYWTTESQLMIVMELADGSLCDRAEECRRLLNAGIPVAELLGYFRESAEALDHLHSMQVLHRDIKPANILLAKKHAKVGDFGLARVLRRDQLSITATSMGTPLYMPPEVWRGKACPQSDQYSLAVTYVELRLGRPAFASESFAEVMREHLEGTPDLGSVPDAEQQVILKALSKDFRERYPSCLDFARALEEAVKPPPPPPPPSWPRWVLAAVLMVVVGLVIYFWTPSPKPGIVVPAVVSVTVADTTSFVVSMNGPSSMNLAELKFVDLPVGITMDPRRLDHNFEIEVAASLDAVPGSHPMKLVAELSDMSWEASFELQVLVPVVTIPHNYRAVDVEPADGGAARPKLVASEGKIYYQRIEFVTPGGRHVEFVLMPRNVERNEDPNTFYIMIDKVWNELFAEFAAERPTDLDEKTQWMQGAEGRSTNLPAADHPKLPVMRVTWHEAEKFSAWLKGKLPKVDQWDKAAGRFDRSSRQLGPYQGVWNEKQLRDIAVGQSDGPLPVGAARLDVSQFQCRDMAGNGREWTRTPRGKFEGTTGIELRGRAYNAPTPLTFDELGQEDDLGIEVELDNRADPTIGFRVVLEP